MAVNIHSDHVLRKLRKPGETGYKIPRGTLLLTAIYLYRIAGGMFEWVSAANLFGEILEWFGYAVFAQTLPAVAFSVFTFSNLVPRALEHHK